MSTAQAAARNSGRLTAELAAARRDRARTETLLEVDGMTTRYGETTAVSDLSFSVQEGEFFTLLGPSGCGKSTTLMSLAGFEAPTLGSIKLRGREITGLPPEKRGMGVVFQSYALFPHLSAIENVAFPLKMRGTERAERLAKARDALELVELSEAHHGSLPERLSGGQQQRVAVARAMVFDPDLLLMDEPLAALDRRLRETLQFELRHLQARLGTTVIYVTHDQEEALVLSDRIGVMRAGRFEQVGSPEEVYEMPANAFVAGFLGGSNTVRVAIVEASGDAALVLPGDRAGEPFEALNGGVPASEREALLVVRPENVRLASGPPETDRTGCEAIVRDVAYMGDHRRVEVEVFEAATWTVPITSKRDESAPELGTTVWLEWDTSDARLVPLS